MRLHRKIITLVGFSLLLIMVIAALSLWNMLSDFSSVTIGTEPAFREAPPVESTAQETANRSSGKNDAHRNDLSGHVGSLKTRMVRLFFTILLTSAGFLLVFAIFIHRTVATPLCRLLDGVRKLRPGEPDYQLKLQGTNDIDQIAAHLNGLADMLKGSYTELKQSNEKFARAGLAVRHEINNPLTTIIGNVELLIERYADKDKDLTVRLEVILNNALRIAEITKQLQGNNKEMSVNDRTADTLTDLRERKRQP